MRTSSSGGGVLDEMRSCKYSKGPLGDMLDNSWEELKTKKHELALTKHSYIINIPDQIHMNYYIWKYLSTGLEIFVNWTEESLIPFFFWGNNTEASIYFTKNL